MDPAERLVLFLLASREDWQLSRVPAEATLEVLRGLDHDGLLEVSYIERPWFPEASPEHASFPADVSRRWFSPLRDADRAGTWAQVLLDARRLPASETTYAEVLGDEPVRDPWRQGRCYFIRLTESGRVAVARERPRTAGLEVGSGPAQTTSPCADASDTPDAANADTQDGTAERSADRMPDIAAASDAANADTQDGTAARSADRTPDIAADSDAANADTQDRSAQRSGDRLPDAAAASDGANTDAPQEPALKKAEQLVVRTMLRIDPSRLVSVTAIVEAMDRTESLSPETVRSALRRLIDLGLAERPEGCRQGARLTRRGRASARQIEGSSKQLQG